jgi:hypothetical protein
MSTGDFCRQAGLALALQALGDEDRLHVGERSELCNPVTALAPTRGLPRAAL